jgi:hypothetical protein
MDGLQSLDGYEKAYSPSVKAYWRKNRARATGKRCAAQWRFPCFGGKGDSDLDKVHKF